MTTSLQSLKQSFDEYFGQHIPFPQQPINLYEPCHYMLANSGKRVRPLLCLIAAKLFQEDITEDMYKVAMAIELFHNFTLIHDDIMDNAPLRRGQPTIHERFGITAGILSGDVMNIYSYKCLSSISANHLAPILDLFNQTAIEVCEGQQLDMDYERRDNLSEAEYLEMIRLKTSVLIGCGLKAGAILTQASHEDADRLYDIGINLGLAFQLQDDYLDTFGISEMTGKQIGGDILADKNTYLLVKAKEMGSRTTLDEIINIPAGAEPKKIANMIAYYKTLSIDEMAKEKISYYFNKAKEGIETFTNRKHNYLLDQLVNSLLQRNY